MPAFTPSKPLTSSSADKENTPQPSDVAVLAVKSSSMFLSPPSAVSTRSSVSSMRSSISPLSTSSANLLAVSPRAALAPRSPNVRLLPVRPADKVRQTVPAKPKPAVMKTGKRTSPPLIGQRKPQPVPANNKPKRTSPPASEAHSTSALQRQIDQLQAQLATEQNKARTLASELRTVRVELGDAKRRSVWMTAEDEEAIESYWHDVNDWDFYDAINSDRSSGSEADEDEEDEGSAKEEDDAAEDESSVHDEEEDDADNDSEEVDDGESHVTESDLDVDSVSEDDDQPLSLPVIQTSPQKHTSIADINSVAQQFVALSCQSDRPTALDKSRSSLSSIHSASQSHREGAEQEDEDDEEEEDEAAEVGDVDDSSHHSASTTSSVVSFSTPGFTDSFPYERNLYLLSRHYRIHTRLYSCPDAITYKAFSPRHNTNVVLKLSEGYSSHKPHPKEVRVLTSAQGHPNIMRLRGWWGVRETGCYCFVTDWVDNCGVDRLWDVERDRREYMRGLLQGLAHLHSRNILYRDVKPSNVLWNPDTRHVTIIDFDVATYYSATAGHRSIVGTSGYMAPEMLAIEKNEEGTYGQQVDVYSAGVVLGQLVYHIYEDEVADESRRETKRGRDGRACSTVRRGEWWSYWSRASFAAAYVDRGAVGKDYSAGGFATPVFYAAVVSV